MIVAQRVAREPLRAAAPMRQFVKSRIVKVVGVGKGGARRHRDIIAFAAVIGLAAADAKIGAGRRDQRLGMWDDFGFGARRRIGREAFAQALALRSEEHTSELQALMRKSYVVLGLKKKY